MHSSLLRRSVMVGTWKRRSMLQLHHVPVQLGERMAPPENGGKAGWRVKDSVPAKSAEIQWCPSKKGGPRSTEKSYCYSSLTPKAAILLVLPLSPLLPAKHSHSPTCCYFSSPLVSCVRTQPPSHGRFARPQRPPCRGSWPSPCSPASRLICRRRRTTSWAPTTGGTPTSTTPSGPATRPSTSATSSVSPSKQEIRKSFALTK